MGQTSSIPSQSSSVYAPIFVSHEHYSCKKACLWEIFKAHVDVVRGKDQETPQPLLNRVIHLVLAALELLPVIGQIVSLIEFAVEHILHARKEKQALAKYSTELSFIKTKFASSNETQPCSEADLKTCIAHLETMQKVGCPLAVLASSFRMLMKMVSDCSQAEKDQDIPFQNLGTLLNSLSEELCIKIDALAASNADIKRLLALADLLVCLNENLFYTACDVSGFGCLVKFNESNKILSATLVLRKDDSARKYNSELTALYKSSLFGALNNLENYGFSYKHEHGRNFDHVYLSPCAIKTEEQN